MMSSDRDKRNEEELIEIVLWGPSAVGKDTLLRAFSKQVKILNDSQRDDLFNLYSDHDLLNATDVETKPAGTPNAEDIEFEFSRTWSSPIDKSNKKSKLTLRYAPINHKHRGVFHNHAGGLYEINVLDPAQYKPDITALYHNCVNFMIVLDLPQAPIHDDDIGSSNIGGQFSVIAGGQDEGGNDGQYATSLSDWSKYEKLIDKLLDVLSESGPKNIAICMTKADQLEYSGKPKIVLEQRYGQSFSKMIEKYSKNHTIEVFHITSHGYIDQGPDKKPNFDQSTGWLIDKNRWTPINAAMPFFWFFELAEKKRLAAKPKWITKVRRDAYLPYPSQKLDIRSNE